MELTIRRQLEMVEQEQLAVMMREQVNGAVKYASDVRWRLLGIVLGASALGMLLVFTASLLLRD